MIRRLLALTAVAILLAGCGSSLTLRTATPTPRPPLPPLSAPSGPAGSLQEQYIAVVKQVAPSVVQIETDQGLGSGIVYDGGGDIVTNAHVVAGSSQATVTESDGKHRSAQVVGSFPPDDIAVVRVSGAGSPPATFADSSKLQVGDIVMAIGNPLGLRSSVTEGIVSAIGRTVSEENGYTLPDVIQTSAAINPGNSGGALVDLSGQVVGIPTLAAADPQLGGGAAPGIGFAIPSSRVKDIAGQLIGQGKVTNSHRAYLGIRVATSLAGGVIIARVEAGGPADRAGLRPGDEIVSVNGKPIDSPESLNEALAGLHPGDQATIEVRHEDGGSAKVTVTLGQLPGG